MSEINKLSEIEMLDKVLEWFARGTKQRFDKGAATREILKTFSELNTKEFGDWENLIFRKTS